MTFVPIRLLLKGVIDYRGKTPPFEAQGIPCISAANVKNGNVLVGPKYVSESVYQKWTTRGFIKSGDVLFTTEAPVAEVAQVPGDRIYLITRRVIAMQVDPSIAEEKYLKYILLTEQYKDGFSQMAHGATVPRLYKDEILDFEIPCPSLPTQKKIAAILSAYDDLIENHKRRIALLENMAEEIYREWFVRFRFPGYQAAEFEKGIPKGWDEGAFDDISNILMGQSPKSEFYNTSGDGLPFHQGVGSYRARFPINEVFCSVDGRTAKEGDILFSVRAPVGRLNIANDKLIIGRGLAAISHKKGCNSYLFYLLKVAFANEDIIGNGAIFNSVGKDELKAFKIFLPPSPLVDKFENQASIIDKQIRALLQSVKNLEKTKNMLLPRLISGKLSVEELDIQFPPSMQQGGG